MLRIEEPQGGQLVPQLPVVADGGGVVPGVDPHAGIQPRGASPQRRDLASRRVTSSARTSCRKSAWVMCCWRARVSRSGRVSSICPSLSAFRVARRSGLTASVMVAVIGCPPPDIQEYTDPEHDPMIPHTLVLKPGLVIHSIYNGYWFWGRPSNRGGSGNARSPGLVCRRLAEPWRGMQVQVTCWQENHRRGSRSADTGMRDAGDRTTDRLGTHGRHSRAGRGGLERRRARHGDADLVRGHRSRRP